MVVAVGGGAQQLGSQAGAHIDGTSHTHKDWPPAFLCFLEDCDTNK